MAKCLKHEREAIVRKFIFAFDQRGYHDLIDVENAAPKLSGLLLLPIFVHDWSGGFFVDDLALLDQKGLQENESWLAPLSHRLESAVDWVSTVGVHLVSRKLEQRIRQDSSLSLAQSDVLRVVYYGPDQVQMVLHISQVLQL